MEPILPALATAWQAARAPAQRSSLVVEARWSHPLRLRFPLLATARSGHGSARASSKRSDRGLLRSLWFPALAAAWQAARAPAQRSSLVVEARRSHPLRLRFPLLPLRGRPLGPRLSGVLCSLRPGGRIRFAFVSRSWLRPARATAPHMPTVYGERIAPCCGASGPLG